MLKYIDSPVIPIITNGFPSTYYIGNYSMFTLSSFSSTYSGSGISGMFHPHETGCNGHVLVHTNCDIERLTSRAYTLVHKCREQAHFSVLLSNTFQLGKPVRSKGKRHLLRLRLCREEIEKKSRNGGITICSFKPNVTRNWVWLNYHGTQQQLHARRDD